MKQNSNCEQKQLYFNEKVVQLLNYYYEHLKQAYTFNGGKRYKVMLTDLFPKINLYYKNFLLRNTTPAGNLILNHYNDLAFHFDGETILTFGLYVNYLRSYTSRNMTIADSILHLQHFKQLPNYPKWVALEKERHPDLIKRKSKIVSIMDFI